LGLQHACFRLAKFFFEVFDAGAQARDVVLQLLPWQNVREHGAYALIDSLLPIFESAFGLFH